MGGRSRESEPRDLPTASATEAEKLAKRDKLNFRPWLWLQHHEETEFMQLARLVLSGGPESIWVSKPIRPQQVCWDIEQFYASGQNGITKAHVRQARNAIEAYFNDTRSVQDMIEDRGIREQHAERDIITVMRDAAEAASEDSASDEQIYIAPMSRRQGLTEGGLVPTECNWIKPTSGQRCQRRAVVGAPRCDLHGGEYLEPEEIRDFIRRGQDKIIAASSAAIDTCIDLMQNSVQDPVRLKAAEMLLDRAGFKPGMELSITAPGAEGGSDPAEILRQRLDRLGEHYDGKIVDQEGNQLNGSNGRH